MRLVNIASNLWGIVFTILAFGSVTMFERSDQVYWKNMDNWKKMFFLNAIALGADVLANAFDGGMSLASFLFNHVGQYAEYYINFILLYYFSKTLAEEIGDNIETKALMIITRVLLFADFLVVTVNMLSGWIFTIDAHNVYHRMGGYVYVQIMALIIEVANLCVLFRYHKKIATRLVRGYALFILLPVIAVVLQTMFFGISIIYLATTLSLLVMYMMFQQQAVEVMLEQEQKLNDDKIYSMLSQLQPHFLYNSLTAIMAIEGNPPQTKKAISDFAKYLRGNMDALKNPDLIPFELELRHIETYVNLEKLRFEDKLDVVYRIETKDFMVPALSVQMMVENAIKHGITPKKGRGRVSIKVKESIEEYRIIIEDDGVGFDPYALPEDGRSHIGLSNTKERLHLLAGGTMKIESKKDCGTTVEICIPMKEDLE